MAALKPPTTLRGVVDDQVFDGILSDALEHVPDMVWPLSVPVFAQMRRDPQLAAVLKAYTLLVRRARWTVDGSGCRPEVVQVVADDLGLPVAGQDRPTGARLRGVSWREHLRAALLHLTYGHAGFAMQADTSSGLARLVALAERMPHTIAEIHADGRTGAFKGITQQLTTARLNGQPEIKAEQMVWYCHEREGASWQGQSLMRPAYGAWVIKREMQRVLATSNRRFGMGVPTVEWAPGVTVVTPQQHEAALAAASAARVGDQSGLALPPGARLVLTGVTGSAPDTLAFIRWLDQQISGMALARFMDLGESSNGSRALGEAFVEFFQLAVQTVADDVAETATRHAAARIVEWNWGIDEPVPLVSVADVGAREDITAEAIKALIDGKALTADPGLEAYLRRRYRLPERDQSSPPPRPPTPAEPVAASRRAPRKPRKEPSPGQLALPILGAARQPTAQELAAGVDPAAIQQQWQQQVNDLAAQWQQAADPITEEIVAAIVAAVAAGILVDLIGSGGLVVSAAAIAGAAALIAAGMLTLAAASAAQVAAEVTRHGVTIDLPVIDDAAVNAHAAAAAQIVAAGYVSGATQVALANAGPDADSEMVGQRVREHLDATTSTAVANDPNGRGWVVGNLGAVLSQAQGMGRLAAFRTLEAAGHAPTYVASEVNDGNQCEPCAEIDGVQFSSLADAIAAYPLGQYWACLGQNRCRGFLFAVVA